MGRVISKIGYRPLSHLLSVRFHKYGIGEVNVKENVAGGEVRFEPRSQTSVRFKFSAMVKIV